MDAGRRHVDVIRIIFRSFAAFPSTCTPPNPLPCLLLSLEQIEGEYDLTLELVKAIVCCATHFLEEQNIQSKSRNVDLDTLAVGDSNNVNVSISGVQWVHLLQTLHSSKVQMYYLVLRLTLVRFCQVGWCHQRCPIGIMDSF